MDKTIELFIVQISNYGSLDFFILESILKIIMVRKGDIAVQGIITEKIKTGRILSIAVPLAVALLMAFGNDYIMLRSINTENDLVELRMLKEGMVTSNICLVVGLTLAIFVSNMLFRIIIRQELVTPLFLLRTGMEEICKGNYDYQIKYEENDSMFEIYDDFNAMAIEMRRFAAKASSVDEGRKQLLLSISHDLRSPLTSIIGYVQGMLDGIAQTEEKKTRYLQNIKTRALEIDRLVNRLFGFARLDSGGYQQDEEIFYAGAQLKSYLEVVKNENKDYQVKIKVESDGKIKADKDLFDRICANLMENSIKYNDKEQGKMVIRVKSGKDFVKLSFRDNGPGVGEEDLIHLWDLFYRTDEARKNPGKSSGIGLSIVKKAVETMDGKVVAKNSEKGGLEIVVRLPIEKDKE